MYSKPLTSLCMLNTSKPHHQLMYSFNSLCKVAKVTVYSCIVMTDCVIGHALLHAKWCSTEVSASQERS